jgi:transposase
MPKPYSLDLRERVVRFVDEGHSRHAAAAHFRVSVSFVVNLVKAFRVRGSLAPKPSGGRRHGLCQSNPRSCADAAARPDPSGRWAARTRHSANAPARLCL